MKNFLREFKTFAMKGNVMDLAIAVIIGTAFGKIVSSLVENIIMPLIGAAMGGKNFDSYTATVGKATLKYGLFLSAVLDFLIIALALFMMVRILNRLKRKHEVTAAPQEKPEDVRLLEEIRDLLKNR